jgi:hypothetical protein
MHCGRCRYMKLINEDAISVTTKVVVKHVAGPWGGVIYFSVTCNHGI